MPAPTVCTISGTIKDVSGTVLAGATITVTANRPFIHPSDSSFIANYAVSTTSGADGTFSLNVIETTTASVSLTLSIKYPLGSASNNMISTYYITVPNSSSATLASLISSQ